MTKLPNGLEVEQRTYAPSEVVQLVLRATAEELAAALNLVNALREKGASVGEVAKALRERAHALGVPHMVDDKVVTAPLDVDEPRSS